MSKEGNYPQSGLISEIIEWILESNEDPIMQEKFIATFPQVLKPDILWIQVEKKWIDHHSKREKMEDFVRQWIERALIRDFLGPKDRKLYTSLLQVIGRMDVEKANLYKLAILKIVNKKKRKEGRLKMRSFNSLGTSEDTGSHTLRPPKLPLGEVKAVLEPGRFEFNDLDPLEVAQQLTLIENALFREIRDNELLNYNPKNKKRSPNISRMVERFNSVSYWVATEIMMQTELKQRISVLKKFIDVAQRLKEMNNFNGVMEVIGGLNMFVVTRLKGTWEQIPTRSTGIVQELNALLESRYNFKEYRNALKNAQVPVLPYLGLYLRDITFVEDGNPYMMGDPADGVINYEKLNLLGDIIVQVKHFQESPYPFEFNDILQDYLNKLLTLPEEMLYKHSLLCEADHPPT